jgi:hypothetical protein
MCTERSETYPTKPDLIPDPAFEAVAIDFMNLAEQPGIGWMSERGREWRSKS